MCVCVVYLGVGSARLFGVYDVCMGVMYNYVCVYVVRVMTVMSVWVHVCLHK